MSKSELLGDLALDPFRTLVEGLPTVFNTDYDTGIIAVRGGLVSTHHSNVFHDVTPVDPNHLFLPLLDTVTPESARRDLLVLETIRDNYRDMIVKVWDAPATRAWRSPCITVEETVREIHDRADYSYNRHIFCVGKYIQSVTGSDAKYLHYFSRILATDAEHHYSRWRYQYSTTVENGKVVRFDATKIATRADEKPSAFERVVNAQVGLGFGDFRRLPGDDIPYIEDRCVMTVVPDAMMSELSGGVWVLTWDGKEAGASNRGRDGVVKTVEEAMAEIERVRQPGHQYYVFDRKTCVKTL